MPARVAVKFRGVTEPSVEPEGWALAHFVRHNLILFSLSVPLMRDQRAADHSALRARTH
jgi:hypothetical protein